MAMPEMDAVKDLALKYPKNILGRMAQMGQISSTLAVMAGMMRDRIVQSEMKPPTKTVAQEVLPAGLMAAQGFTDPTAAQQPVMRRAGGLTRIPVRDNMYEMAGGGIVAFQAGGQTSLQNILKQMSMQELEYYNRTGRLPEKYRMMVPGAEPTFTGALQDQGVPSSSIGAPMAPTPSTTPRLTFGETTPFVGVGPEQVDPFSGTQTYRDDRIQTDPGEVSGDQTPSTAMLKQAAEDEAKRTQERRAAAPAAPAAPKPTGEAKPQGTSFDSILSEIQGQMPQGEAYGTLEREVLKDRESRAQEKKDAGWLRLAEAGLNIAGGESPYFAVNVGKGAAAALKGYAEDLKDQKKLDREDRKVLADIEQARRAEKAGNIKLASERFERALDRASQADQNRIRVEAQLRAAMMSANKPADQVQMIREMMKDPKFKEAALGLAAAQAAAKNPLDAAIADRIKAAASGGGGSNLGAQLGELMKKYPQAFQ